MEAQAIILSEAKSKAELTVNNLYKRIDEAKKQAERDKQKLTLVNKAKELLSTAIDKNDQLVQLALRHVNKKKTLRSLGSGSKEQANLITIV